MKTKPRKYFPSTRLRAKLSFDDGFAEKPIYIIKAQTGEKEKGINMLELIESNFNIDKWDRISHAKKKLEEWNNDAMMPTEIPEDMRDRQNIFTRDDKGNIISPFKSKKKLI